MKKFNINWKAVRRAILWILIIAATLLGFSLRWMLTTWSELTFEEVLFQLTANLEGTGNSMIGLYALNSIVPTVVIVILILLFRFIIFKNSDRKKFIMPVSAIFGVGLFLIMFIITCKNLGVIPYIKGQLFPGTFIEENYVNPENVEIEFPEEKRNLIYIFMESGEITFADSENGGAFEKNVIPELTTLAQENEDFSGTDTALNGGVSLYDTTWTMAAIFGQTSGLPLKTSLGRNGMATMESFFPDIVTLGDILENNGYKQVFMLGSPAVFGGRDTYFTDHGNFEIQDYYYMQEQGKIPEDYYVFWGYEDHKLFEFAKEELGTLSQGEEPFNLTLLTVDTHFEDGYLCEQCEDEFDDQYSNVYACASKQISEFVEWAKTQDWYDNTTIVISGDHPTMDMDYCENVDESYERKVYTTYINAAVEPETDEKREYSTFDDFPTTIAALGATIPGNRLGLGTNLFSSEETLLEKYGKTALNSYLQEKSEFLNELMDTGEMDYVKYNGTWNATVDVTKGSSDTELNIEVSNIMEVGEGIESVDLYIYPDTEDNAKVYTMEYDGFTTYKATVDTSDLSENYGHIKVVVNAVSGTEYTVVDLETDLYLLSETYVDFLTKLKEYQDAGKDITILTVAQSAASNQITSVMQQAMNDLGFETDYANMERQSYYGVIDQGTVTEKLSRSYLTYKGTFADGTEYKINSGGYFAGQVSHMIVNGIDYTKGLEGFNYIIYDNTNSRIISTEGYVTQLGEPDVDFKMISYDEDSKELTVKISQVQGVRKWDRKDNTVIKYFDPADQSTLQFVKMTLDPVEKTYSATLDLSDFVSDRVQFQINCVGVDGKVRITESISTIEYLKYTDVDEYLDYLAGKDNIAVLMAVKSTGLDTLADTTKEKLKALGLTSVDSFGGNVGYAAVIDSGSIAYEQMQTDAFGEAINGATGTLSDGSEYSITSAGEYSGNAGSIYINGTDYSLNRKGLNIVVYDLEKGEVVDTVVINATGEYIASR